MLPALTTLSIHSKFTPRNLHGPIRKYGRLAHIYVQYRLPDFTLSTSANFNVRTWGRRTQEEWKL